MIHEPNPFLDAFAAARMASLVDDRNYFLPKVMPQQEPRIHPDDHIYFTTTGIGAKPAPAPLPRKETQAMDLKLATENLDFSEALNFLKNGFRLARAGWNGKGMHVIKINPSVINPATKLRAHLLLKTTAGDLAHWSPSDSDLLANDWYIIK